MDLFLVGQAGAWHLRSKICRNPLARSPLKNERLPSPVCPESMFLQILYDTMFWAWGQLGRQSGV